MIYYKELSHVIIEAKCHDLSAGWTPRKADGIVLKTGMPMLQIQSPKVDQLTYLNREKNFSFIPLFVLFLSSAN